MNVLGVEVRVDVSDAVIGIVVARRCVARPSPPELLAEIDRATASVQPSGAEGAVRDLLRFGKYKPTGRGKPASEYLARAASEGRFPRIVNLVDINNLVSLETGLPISLVDLDRAASASFVVRRGRAGESFVFNASGQTIELEDLLLVARLPEDVACANPVKDSMATKLVDASTNVLAVLYAPAALRESARAATERFAELLRRYGDAPEVAAAIIDA